MQPILLIHGYSAERKGTTAAAIKKIYGTFPDDLRAEYGDASVFELDVSRYISLEDGVTIDDISRGMERGLREEYSHLLRDGFNVIIHSTGTLVARNWIRRFSPKPSPIKHLIYLAGANFGSGWAHIGKGQLAKWARFVFQGGAERGVRVLNALELGSSATIDLHLHFLRNGQIMLEDYQVREFCVIGSQVKESWVPIPIRYAHEDGADGVVRVCACNLNFNYLRIEPTAAAAQLTWKDVSDQVRLHARESTQTMPLYKVVDIRQPGENGRPEIPLAIPFQCAHSGDDLGVVTGSGPRDQVLALVRTALAADTPDQYDDARGAFAELTQETYQRVREEFAPGFLLGFFREPRAQYDAHAQVVFRIVDQNDRSVEHFDIHFNSGEMRESRKKRARVKWKPIGTLFEDKHLNQVSSNVIAFYLRVEAFDKDRTRWINEVKGERLPDGKPDPNHPGVGELHLEVTATEPETDDIVYLPLRVHLTNEQLCRMVEPHRTTIVDVRLMRLPSPKVFIIRPA